MRTEDMNDIYREMCSIIGLENTQKIYEFYKGQVISFPARIYAKEYVMEVLKSEYDGTNAKELARRLGYTERWIRKLGKRAINE